MPDWLVLDALSYPFMQRALLTMLVLSIASGVVGYFVSLRDLEFVTDGLIHAVFPGLVVGFAIGGVAGILPGAFVAGLIAAVLLTVITRTRFVTQDAAIAVVLTSAFSLGIVLVSRQENYVSQLEELLFGRLLTVTNDQLTGIVIVSIIAVLLVATTWRKQLFRAFDETGFVVAGHNVLRTDLVLNIAVAMLVVAGVQAIGSLMVLALLIVPMAVARLVTRKARLLIPIAIIAPLLSSALALWLSFIASVNAGLTPSPSALVVLILLACYGCALLFYGLRRVLRRASSVGVSA